MSAPQDGVDRRPLDAFCAWRGHRFHEDAVMPAGGRASRRIGSGGVRDLPVNGRVVFASCRRIAQGAKRLFDQVDQIAPGTVTQRRMSRAVECPFDLLARRSAVDLQQCVEVRRDAVRHERKSDRRGQGHQRGASAKGRVPLLRIDRDGKKTVPVWPGISGALGALARGGASQGGVRRSNRWRSRRHRGVQASTARNPPLTSLDKRARFWFKAPPF